MRLADETRYGRFFTKVDLVTAYISSISRRSTSTRLHSGTPEPGLRPVTTAVSRWQCAIWPALNVVSVDVLYALNLWQSSTVQCYSL